MKSLDVVPIRRARTRTVFELEDEITSEVFFLGGLVNAPPCVVEEDASIDVVRDHLLEKRISAVVVVDAQRSLRGLVTRTDVLRAEPGSLARDAMSPYIFALPAISRIERAAALMAFEDVAHVVVTDSASELVGLVSAVDIARHYAVQTGFLAG